MKLRRVTMRLRVFGMPFSLVLTIAPAQCLSRRTIAGASSRGVVIAMTLAG
jgi:hypothetical protein